MQIGIVKDRQIGHFVGCRKSHRKHLTNPGSTCRKFTRELEGSFKSCLGSISSPLLNLYSINTG
jgi:hypothetical protein